MDFWNSRIKNLEAYTPGEQPHDQRYIKLNTNENPYPPSPAVLNAIRRAANSRLRLYPDPTCQELRIAIAEYHHTKPENIFVGNGSDEVLAFCFGAFFENGQEILFPDISYSFYPVYTKFFELASHAVPVDEGLRIVPEDYLRTNNGIVLPNPNAPTSMALAVGEIEKIVQFNLTQKKVVIIDEAYIDFGGQTCIPLVEQFPNLLVIQTLSKSRSLAGLRIGFALGSRGLIEGLEQVKGSINSYTVDRIAQAGAVAAIKDQQYFEENRNRIIKTREWVRSQLVGMDFEVLDSRANFLFLSSRKIAGRTLYEKLKTRGILVRYFNKARIDNFVRVSIGTDGEMKAFLAAVKEICREENA